ncbi:MAG: GTP cyclohydrolase I [Polyangiaceae bacterium]
MDSTRINRADAEKAIEAFLVALGFSPAQNSELRETGSRVTEAFIHDLCSGYEHDFVRELAESRIDCDGGPVVVVRDIPMVTTCPHHLMLATGVASIAFRPKVHLVGIGALVTLAQMAGRRLVLQEALTESIVAAVHEALSPEWVVCSMTLTHGCMVARGERAHGAKVDTLSTRGEPAADMLSWLSSERRP